MCEKISVVPQSRFDPDLKTAPERSPDLKATPERGTL